MKKRLIIFLAFSVSVFFVNAQIPNINGVKCGTVKMEGFDIFYREAGSPTKPTLLLLHGFPTSSHMFRNLMLAQQDKYHLIAPDYPGYGSGSAPSVQDFDTGATPYKRDLKNIEVNSLPTGHFALEEYGYGMAKHIDMFLAKNNIK
jgi:pimeloyl-ACP methyl ester carboxylesterase